VLLTGPKSKRANRDAHAPRVASPARATVHR
jgi:hypothetical protein